MIISNDIILKFYNWKCSVVFFVGWLASMAATAQAIRRSKASGMSACAGRSWGRCPSGRRSQRGATGRDG